MSRKDQVIGVKASSITHCGECDAWHAVGAHVHAQSESGDDAGHGLLISELLAPEKEPVQRVFHDRRRG
jgi:hypothetical protein